MTTSKKIDTSKLERVSDFIKFATDQFESHKIYFGHGTDNAQDEACYLVCKILRLSIPLSKANLKKKVRNNEKSAILKAITCRIKQRVPAAFLVKEAWFMGLPFYVDNRVLIPRSPLAELIANRFIPWVNPKKVSRILDIGTGSGCLAIAAAKVFPKATVDAIDTSKAALEVAQINCLRLKVNKRVRLINSNLFAKLKGKTYDIIISNPPYVGREEMNSLPKEYCHEPKKALLAGQKGDEIVNRIIREAAKHLSPEGVLVVEVGNSAPLIMRKYPHLPFIWLDFTVGMSEVFLLTRQDLLNKA
jgi:ribosomal protein L3 glutamine methyltransferase